MQGMANTSHERSLLIFLGTLQRRFEEREAFFKNIIEFPYREAAEKDGKNLRMEFYRPKLIRHNVILEKRGKKRTK